MDKHSPLLSGGSDWCAWVTTVTLGVHVALQKSPSRYQLTASSQRRCMAESHNPEYE
jgi:hypothetical protein